jgi:hypothetical protein
MVVPGYGPRYREPVYAVACLVLAGWLSWLFLKHELSGR